MFNEKDKELIENIKIAIIYGENDVDGINKDGIIEKIYKDVNDTAHVFYMNEFLQNHFLDEEKLQENNKMHDVNSIFFEIQELGHLIFAENTSTARHKTGLVYIPKELTSKQKKSLKSLSEQLKVEDYNITALFNLHRAEDGILMGTQRIGKSDILNDFIKDEIER